MTIPCAARLLALACSICTLLLAAPSLSDPPEAITYQGLLTDGSGVVVPNSPDPYNVTFAIYEVAELGSPIWSQTIDVSVTDGLYNVILSGPGLAAAFDSAQTYMELTINSGPAPGLPVVLSPRQQITSVPYALHTVAPAAPPTPLAIIDVARKTDLQGVISGTSPEVVEATGGGSPLVAQLTLPSDQYVVTVLAKLPIRVAGGSNSTLVTVTLLEDCGTPVPVDSAFHREKGGGASWDTLTLIYVNSTPSPSTCIYSLEASTDGEELSINSSGTFGTSIIARADPL